MLKFINIEDSEEDYRLILHNLKKGGFGEIHSRRVQTSEELRDALKNEKWNIVIADYNVPGFEQIDALDIVRKVSKDLPFIVVSGLVGEESVADMMKAGVEDFVIKSHLERLVPVVKRALRECEARLQEAKSRSIAKEALAAKEEMLAIVSHDIKNPLAAILLDAQMLELLSYQEPSLEMMADFRLQAKRILRTVNRLKVLVTDLLEQNSKHRGSSGKEHSFVIHAFLHNPYDLLNEVLDSFKPLIEEKNLTVKKNIVQQQKLGFFDKERIFQVLSNLLGNALKFTPAGGEITIELKENDKGESVFTVSDNGPGISKKEIAHIFDKYWTGGSGNGLGLYICKSIVEAHGGKIHASSTQNHGAKFWFNLPSAGPADSAKQSDTKNHLSLKDQKTIYVIDDDEDLREVICWALEKEGHRVLSYNNAQVALNDLHHAFYPPDLIILDFHMAKMSGSEFLLQTKHKGHELIKDCPVVMISAVPEEVRHIIDPDYFSDILEKPLDLNKLISTVETYVH